MSDVNGSVSKDKLKVGVFGIDVEIPTSSLSDLAKLVGKSTLGVGVVRSVSQWRTKQVTEKAWESLGDTTTLFDLVFRNYLQQVALTKPQMDKLDVAIEWDMSNPPRSPFPNTFVHPSERRIQLAIAALEEANEKASPLKSFGQYLEENPTQRDALLYRSSETWRKIQEVRSVVLSHAKVLANKGEEVDETKAWEALAPEAMGLAKRFMLVTDHPWTEVKSVNLVSSLFTHVTQAPSWAKVEWKAADKKLQERSLDLTSFQDATSLNEVQAWKGFIDKVSPTASVVETIKSNPIAWESPYAVAMALCEKATPGELDDWLTAAKGQYKHKSKVLDVNMKHFEMFGRTLLEHALVATPKSEKMEMCNVLVKHGAVLDAKERKGLSEYTLLSSVMGVSSSVEAFAWVKWIKKNSLNPELSFNTYGDTEITHNVKQGNYEWAVALLSLRTSERQPVTADGKTWTDFWTDFKATHPNQISILKEKAPEVLRNLDLNAPGKDMTALFERQPNDFWLNIDSRLKNVQTAPQIGSPRMKK